MRQPKLCWRNDLEKMITRYWLEVPGEWLAQTRFPRLNLAWLLLYLIWKERR